MVKQIQFFVGAAFFFASWTHAFSIATHITIPNVMLASAAFLFLADKSITRNPVVFKMGSEDVALLVFIVGTLLAAVVSSNAKTTNYAFAYLFSYGFLAIVIRQIVVEYCESASLLKANLYGIVFVSLFVIAEFYLEFAVGFDVQQYLFRSTPSDAIYFIFPRVYGFSEEPTYLAWYYNSLGPVAMVYLWRSIVISKVVRAAVTFLVVIGYILTFSTAGFVLLPLAAGIAILSVALLHGVRIGRRLGNTLISAFAVAIVVIAIGFTTIRYLPENVPIAEFAEGFVEKVTLKQTGEDFRGPRWGEDIERAMENPFSGLGPGYLSSVNRYSSLNLFIFASLEQGVIASSALMIFYLLVGLRLLLSNSPYRLAILVGYGAGVFHLFTMTQHYHPCVWLLLALAYLIENESRAEEVGTPVFNE